MATDTYVGTFRITLGSEGRYRIQDTCGFNNWGLLDVMPETMGEAKDYAQRCHDFKTGRRMSI